MKTTLIITVLTIVIALFSINACDSGGVTEQQFYRETDSIENELVRVKANQEQMKKQIADIMQQLDIMEQNQDNMMNDIDTLKAGQLVIYQELIQQSQEQTSDNWAKKMIIWLQN